MIEIDWGQPLHVVVTETGDIQKFSTIEQAHYWLRRKWPVADDARKQAMSEIDAAMYCMTSVCKARRAFVTAVETAGFRLAPGTRI